MKNIVFVCVENSCRSQLAQAFANIHGGNDITAFSAGSDPSGVINPKAVSTMAELDYDLSTHQSKSLEDIPDLEYDAVVTMGCGDNCPWVKGKIREDWGLPDPKHLPSEEFRNIRDRIGLLVKDLMNRI